MNDSELVAKVRELHKPDPEGSWLYCDGCDPGPYAEDRANWPCQTAEIVYTPGEIKALKQAAGALW